MNPWIGKTLKEMIDHNAEKYNLKSALLYQGKNYSYIDLKTYSERIAFRLLENKVTRGNNVGLWMSNLPEWVFITLACARIGVGVVNLNSRFKTSELAYMLKDSDSLAFFFQKSLPHVDFEGMVKELLPSIVNHGPGEWHEEAFPGLSLVIELGNPLPAGAESLEEWIEKPLTAEEIQLLRLEEEKTRPSDVANIFYTSGTTSLPKGAMQQQQSLLPHSYATGLRLNMTDDSKVLLALPFEGVFGFNTLMATLSHGAQGILMDVFNGEAAVRIIENEKITVVTAVDQIFNEITKAAGDSLRRLSSILSACVVFSAKDPRTEIGRLEKELPLRIIQPYGLSEGNAFSITGCLEDGIDLRAKAGGRPVGATEAKVIDQTTAERLPPGKSGELCIKGSNVTLGYYKNPEATRKAIDDEGWFHTGDLAVEEENGYFFFLGRIKDILKMKGFTVSPAEIEFHLLLHPAVEQCQVIGLPAKHGDDAAIACVIPKDPNITEAELLQYCKQGMASFKTPQKVLFMDSYPVTKGPHGDKVQKNRLRELVADQLKMVPDS